MRDDFNQTTVDILAKRVGVRCSNPACRQLTTGPRSDTAKIVNIGVGAHITAAAPGGPRYDVSLSSDERKSPENGIWLCQNCAKLIDNDPARYTVEIIKQWKLYSEKVALKEIEGGVDSPNNLIDLTISFKTTIQKQERHDYLLKVEAKNLSDELISSYHVDVQFPARVLENPKEIDFFVKDRSNRDTCFFRAIYSDDVIYPGDTKIILMIPYYIDYQIFMERDNLFDMLVKATLFRSGYQPLVVEKPFDDLQFF